MGAGGIGGVGASRTRRAGEIDRCATAAIPERTVEIRRVELTLFFLTSAHLITYKQNRQTGAPSPSFAPATEGSMSPSRNQQIQSPDASEGDDTAEM